ncbi:TonB-dependent receptor [Horticoccus luteus]|uniref:TonB-dependent receptor n=1 Tax=Horticoccus luteus TaxID=2862869 RepID=A0A8F9TU77_9BACT|nr:TonB-dependent receptor [Horticoccus luteus]QYM78373.1 TonB-dependent receptor [Horticoccus luteus]
MKRLPFLRLAVCLAALPAGVLAEDATAPSTDLSSLKQLSLEGLMNLEVSTVSRKDERWWTAPSGIDVITSEDIRRSGAMNLPDALRLGTGVHVGQSSARSWAISIRGMNVLAANKISVAMDGRSLFTPFYSGVDWASKDTLLEDIDRIEVVRGPVGALWGAYAVNGFIQILTKPAWDTQGWLASAGTGTEDPLFVSFRYGGKVNDTTFYRVYAKYFQTDWTYNAAGQRTNPATDFFQTGFRLDALRASDTTFTIQGDYYTNQDLPLDHLQAGLDGFNLLGRWRRNFSSDASLEIQSYVDHTYWLIPSQFEERRTTGSASVQYRNAIGRQDIVVGFDGSLSRDHIGNIGIAQLIPPERTIHNAGLYLEDGIHLTPTATVTLGVKGEHNSFSSFEYEPTLRYAWTPTAQTTVWAALSRSVRTPVRIDDDLVIQVPGTTVFAANDDFRTEDALAYEIGLRHQPVSTFTFDVSAFVYRYDNIRSTEPAGSTPLPLTFKNKLNATSAGGEVTLMYQPLAQLFFKASYRYLDLDFTRDPGSQDNSHGSSEGNDPKHVANLNAHLTLSSGWEIDGFLRYVSALPNPALPGYTDFDLRLGWHPTSNWEISLLGRNLLHRQHAEFITTNSLNEQVHRSITLKSTWRY